MGHLVHLKVIGEKERARSRGRFRIQVTPLNERRRGRKQTRPTKLRWLHRAQRDAADVCCGVEKFP